MFKHPFFWRHFASFVTGAGLIALGLAFPPAAVYLIPAGAGLLSVGGTGIIEPKDKTP